MPRKCVWLVVGALLLPALLSLQSHDAEAVIEPIYTLPFYDSFRISQGFIPGSQTIGYADATGYVIPPGAHHLHFRMQLNGAAFKPEPMSWVSGFGNFGACTGIVSPIGARY